MLGWVWTVAFAVSVMIGHAALAQVPTRTITFISASEPGGLGDIVSRLVAGKMTENGMTAVVVIKSGGGGLVAGAAGAQLVPDGTNFLVANISSNAISPLLQQATYDPERDFIPVVKFGNVLSYLIVNPDLPVNSVAELIAYAKANPDKLNYASQGRGSSGHVLAEQFNLATGLKIAHVPFRGGGPALQELLSGRVQMFFDLVPLSRELARAGKVKPLAVGSRMRLADFPNVPTFAEIGYPALEGGSWFGLAAPKGTPKDAIDKLNAEVNKALQSADVRWRLEEAGWTSFGGTPEEFGNFLKQERERWADVIRRANIQ